MSRVEPSVSNLVNGLRNNKLTVHHAILQSHAKALITRLKLYCGYKYTRPFMINRVWGLKQLWLQVNGYAWLYLLGLCRPVWKGNKRKIQNENYMSPPRIEPANLCILTGHLDRLAIEAVLNSCSTGKWQVMRGASPNTSLYWTSFKLVINCLDGQVV